MKSVICFKNNLTKTYSNWIFIDGDYDGYKRQLHDLMLVHPEKLIEQDLHICTVFLVGQYDPSTGEVTYAADPGEYDLAEAYKQYQAVKEAVAHVAN